MNMTKLWLQNFLLQRLDDDFATGTLDSSTLCLLCWSGKRLTWMCGADFWHSKVMETGRRVSEDTLRLIREPPGAHKLQKNNHNNS